MQRTVIASRNIVCLHVIFLCLVSVHAQTDWPEVGHDPQAQRYSPLKQIDVHNVARLAPAWTFQLKDDDNATGSRTIESVPLVVNGRMYVSWPFCHVAALDPETGHSLWQYTASNCPYRGPGLSSMRSVAYWPGDKQRTARILFGTEEGELYALDAKSGTPVEEFGAHGIVNLKTPEIMRGYTRMHYGLTAAPLVYQDLVITGSHIDDETGRKGPAGDVRAWDIRTGKLVWTFHTVPRPGESGHETWAGDSWKDVTGGNVWSFFTLDPQRGILYMPVGSVNNDHYGVDRPGANLFGNSLVAVDAKTGKLKWYFQAIHHDLWDYDMPAAPMLFDVVQHGKKIPAVAVITKNPLLFILNRETGKPVYGVEERPVPKGGAPGEWYSPTQPFPLKPPPLSRLSFTENDFAHITPAHEAACREWYAKFLERGGVPNQGPYTPSSEKGTLQFPDHWGGAWMWGGAFDPTLGYYLINTTDSGALHFIQYEAQPKPAPSYADPDHHSPILLQHPARLSTVGHLLRGLFVFRGWLALLGSPVGPSHRSRRKYGRHCLADTLRHDDRHSDRHSGWNQNRGTQLSRRPNRHGGWSCLHDRLPRPIYARPGDENRQGAVVFQTRPGGSRGAHRLRRKKRKGIHRSRRRRAFSGLRTGRAGGIPQHAPGADTTAGRQRQGISAKRL